MLSISRRSVSLLLTAGLAAALSCPVLAADVNADQAEARVRDLIDQGLVVLNARELTAGERVSKFRVLFDKYFAVDTIARWVLGRFWRQASLEQQREYRRLFEELITYGYVKRFRDYAGQSMQVVGSLPTGDNAVSVRSQIVSANGGQPVLVDWRVGIKDGQYLITDVVVANVSLAQTWRSDFASTIQQNNNSIDAFLVTLRERVAALKAEVEGPGAR